MARQKGVALMAVLLIFAVLAALAVRMSGNHALLIAQSRHQFEGDLALNYALGAEELARQALFDDFTSTGKDVDHLDEVWAQPLPPFEVDEPPPRSQRVAEVMGSTREPRLRSGPPVVRLMPCTRLSRPPTTTRLSCTAGAA